MKLFANLRRVAIMSIAMAGLAGCQLIPDTSGPDTSGPPVRDEPVVQQPSVPDANVLPNDGSHHRVALLVPLTGPDAAVGNSIANATTMALLDTNATNIRITSYDTALGARSAARNAIADGNKLILGPLRAGNVSQVQAEARSADVPVITYSNDASVAGPDVFVMGQVPSQSIMRSVGYVRRRGAVNFAAIVPDDDYGREAQEALADAIARSGGRLIATERYSSANTSIKSAALRLRQRGGFDTVLIADGARLTAIAAEELRPGGRGSLQLLGTERLSGEGSVTREPSLEGLLFSSISDARFRRFSESYEERFGGQPYRIATLGYDSVLLTLRIARDWQVGEDFPKRRMREDDGFLGLDGAFRFGSDNLIQRAMEVREIRDGQVVIIDDAPQRFQD
ncbi:penicillin-binding protein activator [Qipengyuania sp. JC766]|uniref:penicillin-binding protein activator n=1 Tax=Qipengyuania sp. JC766 TaxID=3232139 RepID=UPI003457A688